GFLCAIADRRAPRWSLIPPTALVALGFVFGAFPGFMWAQFVTVNSDGPMSALFRPIVDAVGSLGSARVALVAVTLEVAAMFVIGAILLPRRWVARLSVAFVLVAMPSLTAYMFVRLLDHNSWSGRPITISPDPPYDWVDAIVGGNASVA